MGDEVCIDPYVLLENLDIAPFARDTASSLDSVFEDYEIHDNVIITRPVGGEMFPLYGVEIRSEGEPLTDSYKYRITFDPTFSLLLVSKAKEWSCGDDRVDHSLVFCVHGEFYVFTLHGDTF